MTIAVLDFSQTVIAAVSVISKDLKGGDAPDLIRHCALNQILKLKKKFGNLVIAVDSRQGYWRKDNFPAYKGHRKHAKAKDDFLAQSRAQQNPNAQQSGNGKPVVQPQPAQKVGESMNFKDLPEEGQRQMAKQAGIQLGLPQQQPNAKSA